MTNKELFQLIVAIDDIELLKQINNLSYALIKNIKELKKQEDTLDISL
jgi:hypothetical protein